MPINLTYRSIANLMSPAGNRARLSILIYHRVLAEVDPIFPFETTTRSFDVQLNLLKKSFNVLPLGEAVQRLKAGTLPSRAACITFDDGYADNYTLALPILQKHGLSATFFIATSYLNGGRMFNDTVIETVRRSPLSTLDLRDIQLGCYDIQDDSAKHKTIGELLPKVKYMPLAKRTETVNRISEIAKSTHLPNDLMMTDAQLKQLHAAGMEIGGHTSHHPILAGLDDEATRQEVASNKYYLEKLLVTPIRLFAYPNGKPNADYRPEQARIIESMGFDAAVSTQIGSANAQSDLYQLPRFTPWHPSPKRFVPALLKNLRG